MSNKNDKAIKHHIDFNDDPVVWFTVLEAGRRMKESHVCKKATEELKRLGVLITYRKESSREVIRAKT